MSGGWCPLPRSRQLLPPPQPRRGRGQVQPRHGPRQPRQPHRPRPPRGLCPGGDRGRQAEEGARKMIFHLHIVCIC